MCGSVEDAGVLYSLQPHFAVSHPDMLKLVDTVVTRTTLRSLEPGKYADFVIPHNDPRKVDPHKISETDVLETWMNGVKVFDRNDP